MSFNDDIEKVIAGIDTSKEPPTEEPLRQYYFIKKCREIIKKKSEELGRPLFCNTVTFGCQMNVVSQTQQTPETKHFLTCR